MATLRFHIAPNAKVNSVVGEYGAAIKIKLRAPAVDGKANTALRSFLSKELKIAEGQIVLERGHKSRDKIIRIDGLSDEEVRSHLHATKWQQASVSPPRKYRPFNPSPARDETKLVNGYSSPVSAGSGFILFVKTRH